MMFEITSDSMRQACDLRSCVVPSISWASHFERFDWSSVDGRLKKPGNGRSSIKHAIFRV